MCIQDWRHRPPAHKPPHCCTICHLLSCTLSVESIYIYHAVVTAETLAKEHQRVLRSGVDVTNSVGVANLYLHHVLIKRHVDLTHTAAEQGSVRHIAAEECNLECYNNRAGASVT